MARRFGFILASIALFGVTHRLVERVRDLHENTPSASDVFLEILVVVSALLMILGTTLLALRFKNKLKWIIATGAAICISSAVVLDFGGRTGLWGVALLYFVPTLILIFLKRRTGSQPTEARTDPKSLGTRAS